MSPRIDDTSAEHLSWLVESRSDNQRATLQLYSVLKSDPESLLGDIVLQEAAQELTAVAFSLWRAVFLADVTGVEEQPTADAERFLANLIAHNTVAYTQDRNAREWTFRY